MMRLLVLTTAALTALAVPAVRAGGLLCACHNKLCHCMKGEPYSLPCTPPCDECRLPPLYGAEHTQKLIDTLSTSCECCERIKAAKKLGCFLHADFCRCPEVLHALVHALTCDPCWQVRKAAAWSLAFQKARVPEAIAALYISARLDHHYEVRDAAADSMAVLLVGRRDCFKGLFRAADVLIGRIRGSYDPTHGHCVELLEDWLAHAGEGPELAALPGQLTPPGAERIPAPRLERPGEKIPAPKEEGKDKTKE